MMKFFKDYPKIKIISIILAIPIVMAFFMLIPLFNFATGSAESWITFWGSYLGALIGAATVYLVTSIQIKEQRQIQLEAIKKENKHALDRDMRQYYFRIEIEKTQEMSEVIDKIAKEYTETQIITTKLIVCSRAFETAFDQEFLYNEMKKYRDEYSYNAEKLLSTANKLYTISHFVINSSPHTFSILEIVSDNMVLTQEHLHSDKIHEEFYTDDVSPFYKDSERIHNEFTSLYNLINSSLKEKVDIMKDASAHKE